MHWPFCYTNKFFTFTTELFGYSRIVFIMNKVGGFVGVDRGVIQFFVNDRFALYG